MQIRIQVSREKLRMKSLLLRLGFSATLLITVFCVNSAQAEAPSEPAKIETGRVLKRAYEFKEAGKEMEYALYVPKGYDGTKSSPLIVALHGLYSNPRQILGYPGFTKHAEEHGHILVAPMGYNSRGWYGSRGKGGGRGSDPKNLGELSEKDVMNVLELIRKDFNIDDDRIYLLGHSMGGGGSMHLAMKYPDIWAAIAPIAPAAYGSRNRLESAKHIPAIVVQGDNDRLVPVAGTRRWIERMKELDMKHQYIEVKGGGHVMVAWQHFDEIFDFFAAHTKAKQKASKTADAE
jgi:poly(3-hydroxybutyrate) depolymerase